MAASPVTPGSRSDAWTEYWATGAPHSCGGSYAGEYGGEIRRFWDRAFEGLADGARVLDVCCGNGALARLLASIGSFAGSGVSMDAVDAASVAPAWVDALGQRERASLRFHSGVDAARLPFPDACFDLCVSQYGVEYAGADAWSEVRRVLAPGGRFAAIVHHADSLPVCIAREECAHIDWLLGAEGPLAATRSLLPWMAMAAAPGGVARLNGDAVALAARQAFRTAMQALDGRAADARWPDVLDEARQPLFDAVQVARERGADAAGTRLEQACVEWSRQGLRARDLVEVAMDREALVALAQRVSAEPPRIGEVRFETGDVAGWAIEVRRGD